MGYIRTHWRGEHSLAHSFWINGVLISVFLVWVLAVIREAIGQPTRPSWDHVVLILSLALFLLGITIWQLVGIWRSAENYKPNANRRAWANAAQMMVAIGFLVIAKTMLDYGKVALYLSDVLTGRSFEEYSVEIVENDIRFVGDINFEAVDEFRKLSNSLRTLEGLVISSQGGFIGAAIELAEIVQRREIAVLVYGECISACTLPLVASPNPAIVPGSVVGFHRGGGVGVAAVETGTIKMMEDFYTSHGVPQSVIRKAMSTPYEDVWTPSLRELVESKIIMYVYDMDLLQFVDAQDWCAARPTEC